MSKIDLGKVVTAAIAAAATQAAADPGTPMTQADVPAVVDKAKEVAKPVVAEAQARIDHATNQEPFYLSRQWWVAMLGIVSSVLGMAGIVFDAEMQKQVLEIILAGAGAITGIVLLYNRYVAKKPIGQ